MFGSQDRPYLSTKVIIYMIFVRFYVRRSNICQKDVSRSQQQIETTVCWLQMFHKELMQTLHAQIMQMWHLDIYDLEEKQTTSYIAYH